MASISTASGTASQRPDEPARGARHWAFRIGAVLVGLAPFVALEGLCVLLGWGRPSVHDDPFVGFRSVVPLFVLNEEQGRYEIPKSRQRYFCPESFAAEKAPNEYRIFCLGGSTVQGNPFAIETSFTTWLEISLQAADPRRRWDVVNCGGVSYASYRLAPILQEVLQYRPDLVILYTGHNEFLEAREFEQVAQRGPWVNAALDAASRLRTFTLVREGYLRIQGRSSAEPPTSRPLMPTEVEALLDYRGGLESYHRDDVWQRGVIAQYRFNLHRMVQMAREAGVRVILVNPVSNFSDSPPFKSQHRDDLTPQELARWESLCEAARRHLHGEVRDPREAARYFEQACALDPLHAGCRYNLAKCYEAAAEYDKAREAYLQAKELDVCPLRILQPMNDAVRQIARRTDTPLLDAQRLFESRSAHGIVGGDWLVDHVHPSIEGHQLLADELAAMLVAQGVVRPQSGWQQVKRTRYQEHFDTLDDLYFVKGTQHMERLRNWAAGRGNRVRREKAAAQAATP
jgi:lysophospholipase L1-like esterase